LRLPWKVPPGITRRTRCPPTQGSTRSRRGRVHVYLSTLPRSASC